MAGTSRKKQETSEGPRSRAKNSRSKGASSGKKGTSSKTDRKTGKSAGKADTKARGSSRRRDLEPEENSFILTEVAIIAVFALSMLLFLSNFHLCGVVGDFCREAMLGTFGKLGYLFPVLLCVGSCFYLSNRGNRRAVMKLAASAVTLLALCGLAQLIFGGGYSEELKLFDYFKQDAVSGKGGGIVGGVLVTVLCSTVGTIGAYLILLVLFAIGVVCITEKSLVGAVRRGSGRAYRYAKDDMDRRREIYEERREERREERQRIREERARGIDMDAATLGEYSYEDSYDNSGEDLYEDSRRNSRGRYREDAMENDRYDSPEDYVLEPESKEPLNPADIFRGSIIMPGRGDQEELTEEPVERLEECRAEKAERHTGGIHAFAEQKASRSKAEPEHPGAAEEAVHKEEGREALKETQIGTQPAEHDRVFVSRRKGSAHAETLRRAEMPEFLPETEELEPMQDSGFETPAREETLLKSIYAERDTRTFAELRMEEPSEDSGFGIENQEEEIYYEPIDADAALAEERSQTGSSPAEADGDFDTEDLAGRDALTAVKEQIREAGERAMAASDLSWEEDNQIVTASGKVMETDADLMRKTLERKRHETKAACFDEDREHGNRESGRSLGREQTDRSAAAAVSPHPLSGRQETERRQESVKKPQPEKKPYVFPPMDLLKKGRAVGGRSEQEYKDTAIKLQQTLKNFGVGVTVTNISCGPAVTRYELHPEQGVKVSKIVSLSDDIKLNLAAADIRIEAPIPGKAAVGIEVPNKETETVLLRDLLESENFKRASSKLSFAVGKDIAGQTVVTDIAKMPHLLIAGATGSGKSVCINTLIMSIIYKSSPEDVKLIMIDPKVVELSVYNGIPHLLIPVVTDPKKASGALNWAVAEMTERYQKFAKYNVRDLKGYNEKIKSIEDIEDENKPKKLPQIIIIVDELADLMMVAPGEVEDAICRLAQLARAAGIHLVIATQRPSVNVITGLIKANIPSRIAFSVSSGVDSRTIIDMNGAEKLLGKGDMLFYPQGIQKPQRVQGAFVSDQEVSRVVEFLAEEGLTTEYDPEVEKKMTSSFSGAGPDSAGDRDAYFEQAARFIIEKDKASIGMLQRMLKIGFNRAARIMDQLAEAGVVGEDEGTKPRKVLMSEEQFEELMEQGY